MVSKSQGFLLDIPHPEDGDEHGDRAENIAELNTELSKHSVFHDDQNNEDLDDADPDSLSVFNPDDELTNDDTGKVADDQAVKARRVIKVRRDISDMMTNHAKRIRAASGHQSGYKNGRGETENLIDNVEFRREWEKMVRMAEFMEKNEAYLKDGNKWDDEPPPLKVKQKLVPSLLKSLAQLAGGDPEQMWLPRYIASRPQRMLYLLAKSVRKQVDGHPERSKWTMVQAMQEATARWNMEVSKRKPAAFALLKNGTRRLIGYTHLGMAWIPPDPAKMPQSGKGPGNWPYPTVVYRNGSEQHPMFKTPCSFDTFKEPNSFTPYLVEEFMERAEAGQPIMVFERHEHKLERILGADGAPKQDAMQLQRQIIRDENGKPKLTALPTKCAVSGDSLVVRKTTGWRSWEIAPTLWGMNVRTARLVVDAAAVEAGLEAGQVQDAPEAVSQLVTKELRDIAKALHQIVEASGRKDEMTDVYDDWGSLRRRGRKLGRLMMEIFDKSDAIVKDLSAQVDEYGNETRPAATQEEIEAAQAAEWFVDPANLAELGKMVVGADWWAISAVATGNSKWSPLAGRLLEYRDRYYFKLSEADIVHNKRELKKIAAKLRAYL